MVKAQVRLCDNIFITNLCHISKYIYLQIYISFCRNKNAKSELHIFYIQCFRRRTAFEFFYGNRFFISHYYDIDRWTEISWREENAKKKEKIIYFYFIFDSCLQPSTPYLHRVMYSILNSLFFHLDGIC